MRTGPKIHLQCCEMSRRSILYSSTRNFSCYQMKSVCLYRRSFAVIGRDMLKIDDWAGQLSDIKDAEAAVQRDSEQYNSELAKMYLEKLVIAADA